MKFTDPAEQRRRAEERLARERAAERARGHEGPSERMVHELRVHQIELEMQNEELRAARAELEHAAALYADIYDFAPVGYFSLAKDGTILRSNLAGARLLGMERARLEGARFQGFVVLSSLCAVEEWLRLTFLSDAAKGCDIELAKPDSSPNSIHLEGARSADGAECRVVALDTTERRRAEELLRRKEALLRTAGKLGRIGGWSVVLATGRVELSPEVSGMLGLDPDGDPAVEQLLRLVSPETEAVARAAWAASIRNGSPLDLEMEVSTGPGKAMWGRVVGTPGRSGGGVTTRIEGAFQDISDRKKAELAVSSANRALQVRNQFNEALLGAREEHGLLAAVCGLAVEAGGYEMAWVGRPAGGEAAALATQAHAGKADASFLAMEAGGGESSNPAWAAFRQGQIVLVKDLEAEAESCPWLEAARALGHRGVACLPLQAGGGALGALALFSAKPTDPSPEETRLTQDMAEALAFGLLTIRSSAERRAAAQVMSRQAALLDKATDAILVRGLDHGVQFWSKGAERAYGWTAEETLGKSAVELLRPDAGAFEAAMAELRREGEWLGELTFHGKQGGPIRMDCRWTLIRDPLGEPESVLAIETDVTEKNVLAARYLRAQRMESIGTLAGGIAHDLNNVLAPILMSIEILKESMPNQEAAPLLDTIQTSAKRGADLIKQVLGFARGVQGERIPVDPRHILADIVSMARESFPKNIAIELRASPGGWAVVGDATQLHQVFMNLCVNARDAMPNGGTIQISSENVALDETHASTSPDGRGGSFLLCRVADTGGGIPAAIQEKIFEPFFTTKPFGQGTGLGLSTTLAIVKSHGGFIQLRSEEGRGSEFGIYLPAATTAALPQSAKVSAPARGRGEVVLVVDDEASIRGVAKRILERFGYVVLLAANGAEASATYAREQARIAVVLTDITMPIMDGHALIQTLKLINPAVKIIASSGLASEAAVSRILGSGTQHFIRKPYTTEAMLAMLDQALQR